MELQYIVDSKENRIAVIIPIKEWNNIITKYPELKDWSNPSFLDIGNEEEYND